MAENNANLGFEEQIWNAACVLWGHIPAAEYRNIKKHKYPPRGMEDAVQTVMTQCELWTDNVMRA